MDYTELIKKINRSQALLDSVYEELAEEYSMTFNALMVIYIMTEEKDVTQKVICDELYLPKSTVHSIVNDFMKKELIGFSDKKIGKEKVLCLTLEGDVLSKKIMQRVKRTEKEILVFLGDDYCKKLDVISDRLMEYFERRYADEKHA